MVSTLTGVYRKLRWADFQSVATLPPGVPAQAVAQTIPSHTATGGIPSYPSTVLQTPIIFIPDTLFINVFAKPNSWRLASVSTWSGAQQVWLINHEQGHYDIYALMVRDFFHRIQAMIGQPFSDKAEAITAIADHRAATIGRIAALQQAYDTDTTNSLNGEEQWNWSCAIKRASQLHRTPLIAGADGRYLRIELADALRAAGLLH